MKQMRKEESTQPIYEQVDATYRSESRRVFATLIRLLEDFDLAEEAVHTAFAAALEQWPGEGVPANPRAWLVSTGRFKAIDALRQRARLNSSIMESMGHLEASPGPIEMDTPEVEDDRLRLIFTVLSPGIAAGRAGGVDAARGVRADNRRDSTGVPDLRTYHCAAHRASQGENPSLMRCPRALGCRTG